MQHCLHHYHTNSFGKTHSADFYSLRLPAFSFKRFEGCSTCCPHPTRSRHQAPGTRLPLSSRWPKARDVDSDHGCRTEGPTSCETECTQEADQSDRWCDEADVTRRPGPKEVISSSRSGALEQGAGQVSLGLAYTSTFDAPSRPPPPRHTPQDTPHTTHHTPHTPQHTPQHTSHATRHTPHVTRHTPHTTRHTPHATHHRTAPHRIAPPRIASHASHRTASHRIASHRIALHSTLHCTAPHRIASLSVSLSLCLSVSLSLCLCLSVSLSLCLCLSVSDSDSDSDFL